ncbi:MAG: hypothetical protein ACAI44_04290 [Candidatus Sericytochromatia bacterium]
MLYRHGDVRVQQVPALPSEAEKRMGTVLAHGELTGHAHRIQDPLSVQFWQSGGETYFEVLAEQALLVHENHRTIALPQGVYHSWMQRAYSPAAILRVRD